MKETAPKKIRFQTLRTLWVPLAIGIVTGAWPLWQIWSGKITARP